MDNTRATGPERSRPGWLGRRGRLRREAAVQACRLSWDVELGPAVGGLVGYITVSLTSIALIEGGGHPSYPQRRPTRSAEGTLARALCTRTGLQLRPCLVAFPAPALAQSQSSAPDQSAQGTSLAGVLWRASCGQLCPRLLSPPRQPPFITDAPARPTEDKYMARLGVGCAPASALRARAAAAAVPRSGRRRAPRSL